VKNHNRNPRVERMALALAEARLELGVSQRELGRLAAVSASTIRKLERGGHVDDSLVVRLATTMTMLELYAPQRRRPPLSRDVLADLAPLPRLRRPTLLQPARPTLGGAA
jgi:transcriptional regulator with XRE-family HTH domain